MKSFWKRGASVLAAAAMLATSAPAVSMGAFAAESESSALMTKVGNTESSAGYTVDLSSVDVTAIDSVVAEVTASGQYLNGCMGYNTENPDYDPDDETSEQFLWTQVDCETTTASGTWVMEDLAGTMSQNSASFSVQFWWVGDNYVWDEEAGESVADGDGTATLETLTCYDAEGNILAYFGSYEDALLTKTGNESTTTYPVSFVGIDPTQVDTIEVVMSSNTGGVNGCIGYTNATVEDDADTEDDETWVKTECSLDGLYGTWSVSGLAGLLDANAPYADVQIWWVNPFYTYDEETEESVESGDGTAAILAVNLYDADGNLLEAANVDESLMSVTSDETAEGIFGEYSVNFLGVDASKVDKVVAAVYVDSSYVNGDIGYTNATAGEDEDAWVATSYEVSGATYGEWVVEGIAGQLDPDYPSMNIKFYWVNPFYVDSGEVDDEGNPISVPGEAGTAKLLSVTLYDAAGNELTAINYLDALMSKTGNEEGDASYTVDISDIDAAAIDKVEAYVYCDAGYANGCIGYTGVDEEWAQADGETNGMGVFEMTDVAGLVDSSLQIHFWWVNPFYVESGEVDEDGEPIMVEGDAGTAYLLTVVLYDADGNILKVVGNEAVLPTEAEASMYGDANLDGAVSMQDLILMTKFMSDAASPENDVARKNCDLVADGSFSANDLSRLMVYLSGQVTYEEMVVIS